MKKKRRVRRPGLRPLGQPPPDSYGLAKTGETRSPVTGNIKRQRVPLREADLAFLPPPPETQRQVEAIQAQGIRVCLYDKCGTVLRWNNPGQYCSKHTPKKGAGKQPVEQDKGEPLGCDSYPANIAGLAKTQPPTDSP